jgi:hypothetical protein
MENGKNLSIFAISHLPFSIRPVFQRPASRLPLSPCPPIPMSVDERRPSRPWRRRTHDAQASQLFSSAVLIPRKRRSSTPNPSFLSHEPAEDLIGDRMCCGCRHRGLQRTVSALCDTTSVMVPSVRGGELHAVVAAR